MRLTVVLIGINVFIYMILAYLSHNVLQINDYWMGTFGFSKNTFFNGAYWQVLTSMFAHFHLSHLGFNMVFLAFFGIKGEKIYGKKRFLAIYFLCGLLSMLPALLYSPNSISAGASGAIFGLTGACLIALRNQYSGGIYTALMFGFVFFILFTATGFLSHLFGIITGFLIGGFITKDWYKEVEEEEEFIDEELLFWEDPKNFK